MLLARRKQIAPIMEGPRPSLIPEVTRKWPADLDKRAARDIREDRYRPVKPQKVFPRRVREILETVCRIHEMNVEGVLSKCNMQRYVLARKDAAKRMRAIGMSLPQIGLYLGKHHTTIYHLLNGGTTAPELARGIQNGGRPERPRLGPVAPDTSGEWAI